MNVECRTIQHQSVKNRHSGDAGQAMVEFALAFPLQLLIIFAVIQLAMIIVAKEVVQYAAFSAARAAMVAESRQEALSRAHYSAALVCSPITGTTVSGSSVARADLYSDQSVISVPGWGKIPKSGISRRLKTYVHDPDFSNAGEVSVVVVHYYELIFPIVSKLFAFAADSGPSDEGFMYDTTYLPSGFGRTGSDAVGGESLFEASTGIWNITGADHIRLRSRGTLVIPGHEEERLAAGN